MIYDYIMTCSFGIAKSKNSNSTVGRELEQKASLDMLKHKQ
jgi:hypothetical protein